MNFNGFIMCKFLVIVLLVHLSFACGPQANSNDLSKQASTPSAESDSMYEIHLFLGTAAAGSKSDQGYPVGERHAILVFLRQPTNTEPDWKRATSLVEDSGWTNVDLQKASKVDPKTLDQNPDSKKAYDEAMSNGKAMIVYSEPVKDGE